MMVFNSALLASGEDNSRTELFTTDFDTKSAIVRVLSCHCVTLTCWEGIYERLKRVGKRGVNR